MRLLRARRISWGMMRGLRAMVSSTLGMRIRICSSQNSSSAKPSSSSKASLTVRRPTLEDVYLELVDYVP